MPVNRALWSERRVRRASAHEQLAQPGSAPRYCMSVPPSRAESPSRLRDTIVVHSKMPSSAVVLSYNTRTFLHDAALNFTNAPNVLEDACGKSLTPPPEHFDPLHSTHWKLRVFSEDFKFQALPEIIFRDRHQPSAIPWMI